MGDILLWLNIHRVSVVVVVGIAIWASAYYAYFRPTLKAYIKRGQRHDWSIDLAAKKAVSRGKTEV